MEGEGGYLGSSCSGAGDGNRQQNTNVEVTTFHLNAEVDNLAFTMGRIEMVKTSAIKKGGVVGGSALVDILISKDSNKTTPSRGRKTWKKNNKAVAKKSTTKSSPSCELLKKRKTVGEGLTIDAKKVCDVEQESTEETTNGLAGVGNDQPCRSL